MCGAVPRAVASWVSLGIFACTLAAAQAAPLAGDADGDGRVGVLDAVAALRVAAGLQPATSAAMEAADLDLDGRLGVTDVLRLLRALTRTDSSGVPRVTYLVNEALAKELATGAAAVRESTYPPVEDPFQGWRRAPYDLHRLLAVFPHLRMRPGYKLAGYQFRASLGANGFPLVIPQDQELPEPPEGLVMQWTEGGQATLHVPEGALPDWARQDVETFLEGDGTPISYYEASLFAREVRELGAWWHGILWSTHEVLLSAAQLPDLPWEWSQPQPEEWLPTVERVEEDAVVLFHSYTGYLQNQALRHRDHFGPGYQRRTETLPLADGGPGYIF